MQRLAIFGGTFNPVHWGHLLIAEAALTQFSLDAVIWVPTYQPPYKSASTLVEFHHRLAMVQQAIAPHPQFQFTAIEQTHSTPSHAIDTYHSLCTLYPNTQWYWIVGLDAFQSLPRWYQHQDFVSACHWLIAPRSIDASRVEPPLPEQPHLLQTACSQYSPNPDSRIVIQPRISAQCQQIAEALVAPSQPIHWHLLEMPLNEISSSLIRLYCSRGRSIRYLVPDDVRDYILRWKLYQTDET